MKFIRIDFARIAKEAFIIAKSVAINNVDALIVNLDLVNTKAKVVIALTSSLKTFFIHNLVKMLKSTIR
jgi:hypothetical protein